MSKFQKFEVELLSLLNKYNYTLCGGTYGDEIVVQDYLENDELIINDNTGLWKEGD